MACFLSDVQTRPRKFTVNVDATLNALLEREDTDNNMQITIEDEGLKVRGWSALHWEVPELIVVARFSLSALRRPPVLINPTCEEHICYPTSSKS